MKYLLLSLLFITTSVFAIDAEDIELTVFKYTKETMPEHMNPNLRIGIVKYDATVVFSSDEYNLQNCERNEDPAKRKGFHVARINSTNTLVILCGTGRERGDEIIILKEQGI